MPMAPSTGSMATRMPCAWLGVDLDEGANREHKARISTPGSRVAAYVIKTDENLMIARHARAVVGS